MIKLAKPVIETSNGLNSLHIESSQLNCRTNQQTVFNTSGSLAVCRWNVFIVFCLLWNVFKKMLKNLLVRVSVILLVDSDFHSWNEKFLNGKTKAKCTLWQKTFKSPNMRTSSLKSDVKYLELLIKRQNCHHVETSQSIYRASQLTVFCMLELWFLIRGD